MTTDRNLLFGVLALQLEFINGEQFIEACSVWSTRKSTDLGEILLDRKWIKPDEKKEVERLLKRKLRKHHGDARTVLGTIADPQLRNMLRDVEDDEVDQTVSLLAPAPGYVRISDEIVVTGEERSHFTLSRVQGEGGLGRVWLARDRRLHRDVALKEIRPDANSSQQSQRRFLREAQITGQLEHPNIVPVYELGHDPQTRLPFYSMRFLDGQELSEAIKELHRLRKKGESGSLEMRNLLNSFLSICHAIGYAHSKGIIHRDLKPSNVMLGAFGEVVVLDWGLAKAIHISDDDPTEADPSVSLSVKADRNMTRDGQAIGTPAYMAPEQARGKLSEIDTRTDIYGLGAILYRILTGKRPHRGKNTEQILSSIKEQPTPEPRVIDSSLPLPLNSICKKAMAEQRSERYQTAAELADDVQRWLADESVSACQEPILDKLSRWGRKHRKLARWMSAAVLFALVVVSISALWVHLAWRAERVARRDATQRLVQAIDTVDVMMTGVSSVLRDQPATQQLRVKLLTKAAEAYQDFASLPGNEAANRFEYGRTQVRLGEVYRLLGRRDEANQAFCTAMEILEEESLVPPSKSELIQAQVVCRIGLAELHGEVGEWDKSAAGFEAVEQLFSQLPPGQDRSRRMIEALLRRAYLDQQADRLSNAMDTLDQAINELQPYTEDVETAELATVAVLARTLSVKGSVLVSQGQQAEAAEVLSKARTIYDGLLGNDADNRAYLEGRAYAELARAKALSLLGDPREEARAYQAAIEDFQLVDHALSYIPYLRENLAIAETGMGTLQQRRFQMEDSRFNTDNGLYEYQQLMGIGPDVARYKEALAHGCLQMGRLMTDQGHLDVAAENLRSASHLYENTLAKENPKIARYRRQAAVVRVYQGILNESEGRTSDAMKIYNRAIESFRAVLSEDPADVYAHDALASTLEVLADLQEEIGEDAQALENRTAALKVRASDRLPILPEYRHRHLQLLLKFNQPDMTKEALNIGQSLISECPDNGAYRVSFAAANALAAKWGVAIRILSEIDTNLFPESGPQKDFWLAISYAGQLQEGDQQRAEAALTVAEQRRSQVAPGSISLHRLHQKTIRAVDGKSESAAQNPASADP